MWSEILYEYGTILYMGVLGYFCLISLIAATVTVVDKLRAPDPAKRRVPENTLLLLSALGGSVAMYITMLMIRHKTRHSKFMIGIPIIILFQAVVLLYLSGVIS